MLNRILLWLTKCTLIVGLLSSQLLPVAAQEPDVTPTEPSIPLSDWQPPLAESASEQNLVLYDVESGQESTIQENLVQTSVVAEADFVAGSPAPEHLAKGASLNAPEEFTAPTTVDKPADYPWSMTVKVFATFTTPDIMAECTGVLIDPLHVLTAGHCLYGKEPGHTWARTIRVVPGYQSNTALYGEARSIQLYSWEGWTKNKNRDWDMGYIRLDRPIGALTGWFGYGYNSNDAFFRDSTFHNPYYQGATMFYRYGRFDVVAQQVLYRNGVAWAGQDGSGAYVINANNDRHVYATLSHIQNNNTRTGYTRINADRFNAIKSRIAANTPSRADLVALDLNVSPSTVRAGNAFTGMNFLLHNYSSSAWNGDIVVKIYLSTDNTITSADRLLATTTVSAQLSPKASKWLNLTPASVPSGVQGAVYVGVTLEVNDANRSNNTTVGWDAAAVQVTSAPSPRYYIYLPLLRLR